VRAAEAEDNLEASSAASEDLAEEDAEAQSETAAELAVENVPPADEAEVPELEAEENEIGTTEEDEAGHERGA
jgi:hypothetical protein